MKKIKLLIVEDCQDTQDRYFAVLYDLADILAAIDGEEALAALKENPDAIIMDGRLHAKPTMGLVRRIRQNGFKGTIIAASTMDNDDLLSAGCDISLPKNTDNFFKVMAATVAGLIEIIKPSLPA